MEEKIKQRRKPLIDIDKDMDIAYIGNSPTNENTISFDLDEDIVAHVDINEKRIIGFTIIHFEKFTEKLQNENLKKKLINIRTEENIKVINEYIINHYKNTDSPIFSFIFP